MASTKTLTYVVMGKDRLSPVMKKAGKEAERTSTTIGSHFSNIGAKLGMLAGTMAKAGAVSAAVFGAAAIKQGVQYNANLEQARTGFTTMLGSAQKAGTFLNQLQSFAAKTPFNFPELVTASQRMLAFGFNAKDVLPDLTAIGDAAAGLGIGSEGVERITTAIGQMQAKTRVQSDEILQLTESGVPALRILANEYGVTTQQMQNMITKGVVQSSEAIPKLLQGIEKGTNGAAGATTKFGGLMAAQSKTLTGMWSNFVDVANMKLGQLIQPAMPLIKTGIGWLTDMMSGNGPVGRAISDLTGYAKTTVGPVFKSVIGAVVEVFQRFTPLFADIGRFVKTDVFPVLVGLGELFTGTIVPIIKRFFEYALPGFRNLFGAVKSVWGSVVILWNALKPIIGPVLIVALGAIVAAFRAIAWVLNDIVAPIVRGVAIAIQGIVNAFKIVINWARHNWPVLLGIITGPIGMAAILVIKYWDNIKRAASVAFNAIVDFFRRLPGRIVGAIGAVGTLLTNIGRNIIRGLFNGVNAIWNTGKWFRDLPGKVVSAVGNLGSTLYQKGKDVIQGFWNGLTFVWGKVTGWISGLAGWIKDHKGPVSLDRTLLEPAGRAIMHGLKVGLLGGWTPIQSIISGAAGSIKNGFSGLLSGLGISVSTGGNYKDAQSYASALIHGMYGMAKGNAEWAALQKLWMGESGWNPSARNPSSGAYGIPQALPASKMASAGSDWMTNYKTQIAWGLSYIRGMYGDPIKAYNSWLSRSPHWYDKGGVLKPGLTMAYNGTGHDEYVVNPSLRSRGGGDTYITIPVTVSGHALASKQEIGREVAQALQVYHDKGGRLPR